VSETDLVDTSEPVVERDAAGHAARNGWRDAIGRVAASRFGTAAISLAAFGLVLRLVFARFEPLPPSGTPLADETWYVRVAHNLLVGRGFTTPYFPYTAPTAQHGPLTVLLLLPATILQPHGYTLQRSTMALLGALAVLTIAYIGRELAGARVGLVAGLLAAIYPGLWVNDLVATSESPALLGLAVVLLLVLRYRRDPTTPRLALLGATLGLLALTRGELAMLGLLLAVPTVVVASRGTERRGWTVARALGVLVMLAVAVVVPWSAYNESKFHQTVLVSNDLGQTLVGANCPQSYYGPLTGYDGLTCWEPVLRRVTTAHPGANEAQYDVYFRQAAVHYAVHHWHRWPIVAVMREAWLWSLWRPGWTVYTSAYYLGRADWISWSQIVAFWLLAPFAIYGAVLARRRRLVLWPLVTMVGFTAAVGLLVTPHLRYRLPTELAFVLLGALAVDRLVLGPVAAAPASVGGSDLDLR
jgi:4-amino-4-deoxy-L-arabinose transferase-like glycosyltransferase